MTKRSLSCSRATAPDPSSTTSKERSLIARHPDLPSLLAAHELLDTAQEPLTHGGFSGATLTQLRRRDGARFVLKRMSIERDWIMRATDDAACREAALAAAAIDLGPRIRTPSIGVAADGGAHALLMHDITSDLLPPGIVREAQLAFIIDGMAALHRLPIPPAELPWCDLGRRLTLLTPATARIAAEYAAPVAGDLVEGWRLFRLMATARAVEVIYSLFDDPSPLIAALGALPVALLHGDLKLDNIGIDEDGGLWLIDWAMTLVAPPALELGWFLAINSRRVPQTLDAIMSRYAATMDIGPELRERHFALTAVCGLLLRGWRKALDANGGEPAELRWWCERVEAAERYL